jgi:hypothetical protein
MDNEKWNSNSIKMVSHFEANPGQPQEPAVLALLDVGEAIPEQRQNAWNSITAMCRGMENNPIGRGRQADIDPHIEASLNACLNGPYRAAYVDLYVSLTTHCGEDMVWLRGGKPVENAEAFAEYNVNKQSKALIKALRSDEETENARVLWDGTFNDDGQITGVSLHPKQTEDSQ